MNRAHGIVGVVRWAALVAAVVTSAGCGNETSNGAMTALTYDATCATPNSWHYDHPANPQHVVLCPNTCSTIQADGLASR